jgi:hypothetical protein
MCVQGSRRASQLVKVMLLLRSRDTSYECYPAKDIGMASQPTIGYLHDREFLSEQY